MNNFYLSNVEDSVPLYREEIIVVVIFVVVVVAGGKGNRGKFTRTGVGLEGSKPFETVLCTFAKFEQNI